MSEAYLTMSDLYDIRELMQNINTNYKNSRYVLDIKVSQNNKEIGNIKKVVRGNQYEYVFTPATATYQGYEPGKEGKGE